MGVFAEAFLAGDVDRMRSLLGPESRFHSPVATYIGPKRIGVLMEAIGEVLRNRRLDSEVGGPDESALFFTATIEGRPVDGVLRVVGGRSGHVAEVTLMLRPIEPLLESVDRMRELLARRG